MYAILNHINEVKSTLMYLQVCLIILAGLIFLYFLISKKTPKAGALFYKYRYLLGLCVVLLIVSADLNGSSIGIWSDYFKDAYKQVPLLGINRKIRTDEYRVLTPMFLSQKYSGFKILSSMIMGGEKDTTMVYALPSLDITLLFRPFLSGFLLFGNSRGLSFFWAARLVFLFIVSFDFFWLLTNKNKAFSIAGAFMVGFSPLIQWWFSINALVEMMIFGQGLVLCFDKFMHAKTMLKKFLITALMIICSGGYALTLYPAWQIPLAYIFGGIILWVVIKNFKQANLKLKDYVLLVSGVFVLGVMLVFIFYRSMDTIKAMASSVYPGKRSDVGGGQLSMMFAYALNILFPYKGEGFLKPNVCENALFYDLFPVGIILNIIILFNSLKKKKVNLLSIIMLVLSVFFNIYTFIGFPSILAKITLLSMSTGARTYMVAGLLNVYMLIYGLAELNRNKYKINIWVKFVIAGAVASSAFIFSLKYFDYYIGKILLLPTVIGLFFVILFALGVFDKWKNGAVFAVIMCVVMVIAGGPVNPVNRGIGAIGNQQISKEIKRINNEDSGNWIVADTLKTVENLPITCGATTINTTQLYPNMNLMDKIDETGKYKDIYNRYCALKIICTKEETSFSLNFLDDVTLYFNPHDFKKIDVKYILSGNYNLGDMSDDIVKIEKLSTANGYSIYKVIYK